MQPNRTSRRLAVMQLLADVWRNWNGRRSRLSVFDRSDPAEMQRIARDFGVPVSELRVLVGHSKSSADLLQRRLRCLELDPGAIELGVMRDMQRCCSQCGDKTLCTHELEDGPKAATWPDYCPNKQTIEALVAGSKL